MGTFIGSSGNDYKQAKKERSPIIKRWKSWLMSGNGGDDTLIGGPKDDRLYGNNGNDSLYGNGGNDFMDGGFGNDFLGGWSGNDTLRGGDGNDRLYGDTGADRLYGGNGNDLLHAHTDNIGVIRQLGSDYSRNYLYGGAGNDKLYGHNGSDYLNGGSGNDTLTGGRGNDTLVGGLGKDTLIDGSGNDTFKYYSTSESLTGRSRRDVVISLNRGIDKIDLSAIDANRNVFGNQAFQFIGTRRFSGGVGQVRHYRSGSSTIVQVDIQGDGNLTPDMEIQLNNLSSLSASDFIL